MGGCGSREKELREKVCFSSAEFDRCLKKFSKLTAIKPGKSDEHMAIEGYKKKFVENQSLAQKVFRWIKSQNEKGVVDLSTYVLTLEMLAKTSNKMYSTSNQLRQLDQAQLLLLISLQNNDILRREQFKLNHLEKQQVSYLNAGRFFRELINMQSSKNELLCKDDDLATMLLINSFFGDNQSTLDFHTFMEALRRNTPQLNKLIKLYFETKFLTKQNKITIPEIKEDTSLLSKQTIALFNLSVSWFYHTKQLNLYYRYTPDEKFNFNKLANHLLKANTPTLLLFRHQQKNSQQPYIFGFFCASYWRLSPDITGSLIIYKSLIGDKQCCIFTLAPTFKVFSTLNSENQTKFAVVKPIITKKTTQSLHNSIKFSKNPGLGLGGSGMDFHRVWIDGKDLKQSYIQEDDKTFEKGPLFKENITILNIDLIEVWGLEQNRISQSMSYFRQTQNIQQPLLQESTSSSKQIQYNDLNTVLSSLQKTKSTTTVVKNGNGLYKDVESIQEEDEGHENEKQ